ncbi:MAG: hypothetical protein IKT98_05430 [Selenomonadaceae bacterium]|nr:hypothetical protein [Selenomonadaceae bacterium]
MNWEIVTIFLTFFTGIAFFSTLICLAVTAVKFILKDIRAKKWFKFTKISLLITIVIPLIQIASESTANLFKVLGATAFAVGICFIGKTIYKFAKK